MPRKYSKPDPATRVKLRKVIGAALAKRRGELSRSLKEAAAAAGCSDAWLCQLETATANIFRAQVDSLERLSLAYEMSVVDLLKLLKLT